MQQTWSKFVKRIPVKTDIKQIYQAWATQSGLEKWFLRKAEFTSQSEEVLGKETFISKDDTYEWLWHGWSDEVVERGTILEANGKDYIKFTFGKPGIVSVAIQEEENENVVELIQEEIPTDEESKINFFVGCSEGWTFYLTNLKSILEGGIDLRNKKVELKNVINS